MKPLLLKFRGIEEAIGIDLTPAVIRHWTVSDPESAAVFIADAWGNDAHNGNTDKRFTKWTQELIRNWSEIDVYEASNWLVDNPDLPSWDEGAREIVKELMVSSEREALEWANGIKSNEVRIEMLSQVFTLWNSRDRTTALEALNDVANQSEIDAVLARSNNK